MRKPKEKCEAFLGMPHIHETTKSGMYMANQTVIVIYKGMA